MSLKKAIKKEWKLDKKLMKKEARLIQRELKKSLKINPKYDYEKYVRKKKGVNK